MHPSNPSVRTDQVSVRESAMLSELKGALVQLLGERLDRVILFGSRVRGEADINSDIDVAILVKDLDRHLKHTVLDAVADIELQYETALSTILFSTEEFAELLKRERRIALDIEHEGICL